MLYFSEGDDVKAYSLEQVQEIYRNTSQKAFCFVIEFEGMPIGECWLQRMNFERILRRYPDLDCRRIDLMIGEKQLWGQGLGPETIRLLTEFGFEKEKADMIFACDVADYNLANLRAFQKVGYEIHAKRKQRPSNKARYRYDLVLTREKFYEMGEVPR